MSIAVQCGSCKKRMTAKDKLAGRKVKCPQCGAVVAIPKPASAPTAASPKPAPATKRAATAKPKPAPEPAPATNPLLDEIPLASDPGAASGMNDLLDEFPLASGSDAASDPLSGSPGPSSASGSKCASCGAAMEPGSVLCVECGYNTLTGKKREVVGPNKKGGGSGPWVQIGAVAGICIFVMAVVFYVFTLFQPSASVGVAASGIAETPTEFVEAEFGEEDFKCEHPKGWEVTNGGGRDGIPPWTKSEKGGASVTIRDSKSGTEEGMLWRALKQRSAIERGEAPVEEVHEHRKQFVVEEMRGYEETDAKKLTHKIGDALISEFTAAPMLGDPVRGYRATVLFEFHQFNILCVCTESEWEILKPAFDHVIASIEPIIKEDFPDAT